jgi:NAD(P)-dependent dehydrogenase (short-subunit alcohol dehydrogenase family)
MEPNEPSSKRIVLITGAKGGLGSFITQAFLGTGETVVGASKSIAVADFPQANFVPLSADFTKAASANEAVQSVATRFGTLDVLAHVMGGFAGGRTVAETDDAISPDGCSRKMLPNWCCRFPRCGLTT